MASLRYEQGKSEEALALLRKSMTMWFRPKEDDDEEEGEEEDGMDTDGKPSGSK